MNCYIFIIIFAAFKLYVCNSNYRAHREKRLANRVISPPSYAARSSPTYPSFRESKSASRSPTPDNTGKITYITSFGGIKQPKMYF